MITREMLSARNPFKLGINDFMRDSVQNGFPRRETAHSSPLSLMESQIRIEIQGSSPFVSSSNLMGRFRSRRILQ